MLSSGGSAAAIGAANDRAVPSDRHREMSTPQQSGLEEYLAGLCILVGDDASNREGGRSAAEDGNL